MAAGVVKWFSSQKGYGFIVDDIDAKEVFVHHNVIQMEGYKQLTEGQKVTFDRAEGPKGECAENVFIQIED